MFDKRTHQDLFVFTKEPSNLFNAFSQSTGRVYPERET
jgi:hypothetical protein